MVSGWYIASILAILLFAWRREVKSRKRRMGLRYDSLARLNGQSSILVEGTLLDVEHETGEDEDPEELEYLDRYLVYSYEVEVGGELKELRGRHFVEAEVFDRASFGLEFGRPVRVRYALYEPEMSCLEDY